MLDAQTRERALREVPHRHHAFDREKLQQRLEKGCADEQLTGRRDAIGERIAGGERMKWKCIPKQGQGLDVLNGRPDHRCTRFGRESRTGGRLSVTAMRAEEAHHDRFAGEGNSGQPAAAIARRFTDEKHSRISDLLEIDLQVVATDRVGAFALRVLIARAIGDFDAGERVDEAAEPSHRR